MSKTVVITGANSGLDLETCKYFVSEGYRLVMAIRNLEKGKKVKEELLTINPKAEIDLFYLNLADLSTVHDFIRGFSEKYNQPASKGALPIL